MIRVEVAFSVIVAIYVFALVSVVDAESPTVVEGVDPDITRPPAASLTLSQREKRRRVAEVLPPVQKLCLRAPALEFQLSRPY